MTDNSSKIKVLEQATYMSCMNEACYQTAGFLEHSLIHKQHKNAGHDIEPYSTKVDRIYQEVKHLL